MLMKLAEVSKQDNKMKNNILEAYAPPEASLKD